MRSKAATSREVEFLVPEEPCEVANSVAAANRGKPDIWAVAAFARPSPIDKERKSRRAGRGAGVGELSVRPDTLRGWHRQLVARRWIYPNANAVPQGPMCMQRSLSSIL
jgi:hypothetical protein